MFKDGAAQAENAWKWVVPDTNKERMMMASFDFVVARAGVELEEKYSERKKKTFAGLESVLEWK